MNTCLCAHWYVHDCVFVVCVCVCVCSASVHVCICVCMCVCLCVYAHEHVLAYADAGTLARFCVHCAVPHALTVQSILLTLALHSAVLVPQKNLL